MLQRQTKNSWGLLSIKNTAVEIDYYKKIIRQLVEKRLKCYRQFYRPQGGHPVGGKK
jgi:hypothetical protein